MLTSVLPTLDPLAPMLAAGCLAALLLHAAWAKLTDSSLFHQHLAAYGLPEALQPALVWLLPLAEAAAALGLVTPLRGPAALMAASLLGSYGLAMAWHLAHGRVLDCGCGGAPLKLSWALVARNAVLSLVAMLAALPSTDRALGWADYAVATATVALASLLYAAFNQLLRQQPAGAASSPSPTGRSPA
jgi:hypothetical protein